MGLHNIQIFLCGFNIRSEIQDSCCWQLQPERVNFWKDDLINSPGLSKVSTLQPINMWAPLFFLRVAWGISSLRFRSDADLFIIDICCCFLVAKSCLSFVTRWTVAFQTLLSIGFPRQEYWSRLPFTSPGVFLTQGSNLGLLHCRQILLLLSHQRYLTQEQ